MFCRLLAFLVVATLVAPANAQAALEPFGSADSLAAFGARLVDWQARLDAEAQRAREERARQQALCDSSFAVTVYPGAIVPTGTRTAVVAGVAVEFESGEPRSGIDLYVTGRASGQTGREGLFSISLDSSQTGSGARIWAPYAGFRGGVLPTIAAGDSLAVRVPVCRNSDLVTSNVSAAAMARSSDAITNNQHAGVDEGGIVKKRGDTLVVLRRGRLFTIDVGGRAPRRIDAVDAYGPGLKDAWFDEMLIVRETVVVIGYSYTRGGTEVGLFSLSDDGRLRHRNTYQLKSNDYYSSRNYTARLVDGRLTFYTPLMAAAGQWAGGVEAALPAMRRWTGRAEARFEPIATATRVYRPARDLTNPQNVALHTVTSCDIDRGELDCQATAVIGPRSHTFYTSPTAVYVWLSDWRASAQNDERAASVVYRLPLDGSAPRAVGAQGGPVDQFSFLEADDHLQVLVSTSSSGQWMWNAERNQRNLALLRVGLAQFGDGREDAPAASYRRLPSVGYGPLVNRYVGGHLLYGTSSYSRQNADSSQAIVVDWRTGASVPLAVPHGVERVEALGRDAVVVGLGAGGLHLTSLRLGAQPRAVGQMILADAAQGESRSHGFFYRPTSDTSGLLGLPIRRAGESRYSSLWNGSAAILYAEARSGALRPLGELAARPDRNADDDCQASCVDWYGNARPLFLGDRVFALMGYELVEGRVSGGRIREVRRLNFAPSGQGAGL